MNSYSFIALSFGVGLLCVVLIRALDKHEKEPFGHLFAVTCWGGLWANFICLGLYDLIFRLGITRLETFWGALFIIGPVEELSKFLALLSSYFIIKNQLDEPLDGILYMACVALGFSLIENYTYAVQSHTTGSYLFFARLAICTPVHISFSALMGLAFYVCLGNPKAYGLLIGAWIYGSMVHGIYDLAIFHGWTIFLLALVIWFVLKTTYVFTSYTTAKSPFRQSLSAFIQAHAMPEKLPGLTCLNCGSTHSKQTSYLGKEPLQKCDHCQCHVTTPKGLANILHHFAPACAKLKSHLKKLPDQDRLTLTELTGVTLSKSRDLVCFELGPLNAILEKCNHTTISKMESHWWFPEYLFHFKGRPRPLNSGKIAWRGVRHLRHWLIFPFTSEKHKKLFFPHTQGPAWNWWAFWVPELWYLYHEIWGVFFLVGIIYAIAIYLSMRSGIDLHSKIGWSLWLLLRILSGRYGSMMRYYRHGKWD